MQQSLKPVQGASKAIRRSKIKSIATSFDKTLAAAAAAFDDSDGPESKEEAAGGISNKLPLRGKHLLKKDYMGKNPRK